MMVKISILKMFVLFIVVTVLLGGVQNVNAECTIREYLIENGYPEETANELEEKDCKTIYEGIKNNTCEIGTCVMEVDCLDDIETFCSSTNKQLLSMGMTKDNIDCVQNVLEDYERLTKKELSKKYGETTDAEIVLIKKAIKNGKNKSRKNKKNGNVNASGSIASSELTFTYSKTDYSTNTYPCYDFIISYNWKKPYVISTENDKILTAWGGGFLNASNISSRADYYEWNWSGWNTLYCRKTFSKNETPNSNITFTCSQSVNGFKNKTGCVKFRLKQNTYSKNKKLETKLVTQYCHQKLTGTISITFSKPPAVGISIGSAWDSSDQLSTNIYY